MISVSTALSINSTIKEINMYQSEVRTRGRISTKLLKGNQKAPLLWKIGNILRPHYLWMAFTYYAAKLFSAITNIVTMEARLFAKVMKKNGQTFDYGVVSHGLVTTAFVNFMVDQMQTETSQWGDFKYHDSGVGTTGAAVGDTDIETTDGESRATGTQTEGASANIYKSVGTISYTSTKAITEHGLFSQSTGTTLLDRHTFSAINVENGDSIEFTYELTVSSGG